MSYTFAGTYGPQQIVDVGGRPLEDLSISIFLHGTTTLAALWTDKTKTVAAANPTTTDALGNLTFFADPGAYDLFGNNQTITVTLYQDPAENLEGDLGGTLPLATLQPTANVQALIEEFGGGSGGSPLTGDVTTVGGGGPATFQVTGNTRSIIQHVDEPANLTDPQWGGADANGDWTTAALAAVASTGNGRLFIPPGSYQGGNSVAHPGLSFQLPGGWKYQGGGREATLLFLATGSSANVLQTSNYGAFGIDFDVQMDGLTIQGNGTATPPWAYATSVFAGIANDTISIALPAEIINAGYTATQIFGIGGLTTIGGVGYVAVAEQTVAYTGTSGATSSTITLTGCNIQNGAPGGSGGSPKGTFSSAPKVNIIHARVYPYNQQGHIVALQAQRSYVGRNVRILGGTGSGSGAPGSHGIWLNNATEYQLNSNTAVAATQDQQLEPQQIGNVGGYYIAIGPFNTDGRLGNFSAQGTNDGYGGILVCQGDWDIEHIHTIIPRGMDAPAVQVASNDVPINYLTGDTGTAPVVRVDQTGHWVAPNAIKGLSLNNYKWESPGDAVMSPGTGPSQGVPIIQTVTRSGNWLTQGRISDIQVNQGYSYALEEGPQACLLGAGSSVSLTAGTLNALHTYGCDPFGGTLTVTGGTGPAYTAINRVGATSSGSNPAANSSINITGVKVNAQLNGALPASGTAVAWMTTGPVEIPFTSVTGLTALNLGATIGTYTGGAAIPANTLITINQFTGCTGGSGSVADLTPATVSGLNTGIVHVPMVLDVNPLTCGGGMIAAANLHATSSVYKTFWWQVPVSAAYTAQDHDYVLATAGAGGFTVKLPSTPSIGHLIRVKKIDSGAGTITVSGNGNTIDGLSTISLIVQYDNVEAFWNGTTWSIVNALTGNTNFVNLVEAVPAQNLTPTAAWNMAGQKVFNFAQSGWVSDGTTWTRTANTTFTVPGNVTTTYQTGTILSWKESGTQKYGIVASSAFTTLTTVTLVTTSDYVMAASPDASSNQYAQSWLGIPYDFPDSFTWSGIAATGGTGVSTVFARFAIKPGRKMRLDFFVTETSTATSWTLTGMPLPSASNCTVNVPLYGLDNTAVKLGIVGQIGNSTSTITLCVLTALGIGSTTWTASGVRGAGGQMEYDF